MRRARGGRMRGIQRRDDFVAAEIPFDLRIEILKRLPAKSLMRFKCVSKLWFCLIRSRNFSNLYYLTKVSSSPSRPLSLYMSLTSETHLKCDSMELCHNPGKSELLSLRLKSSSNSGESSLEPDVNFPGMGGHQVVVLRGLILYSVCRKACIYNPTTRQSLTLPAIKSNIFAQQGVSKRVYYFFGHDPVHDQYKIVCTVVALAKYFGRITTEYWVFVLEPGGFWKRTDHDDQSHAPTRHGGICINGVIYYLTSGRTCRDAIYTFDVCSEMFHKIQVPHEVSRFSVAVVFIEHGGKPALFDYRHLKRTGVSQLWVLEDGGTWSRKSLILKPCQRHLVEDINTLTLMVHGTGQNNEVILVLHDTCYLLCYDLIKNDLRKVNINKERPTDQRPYMYVKVMDESESIMHLGTSLSSSNCVCPN